ncbi:MAG: hypothetical protein FWB93_04955 [Oscillospiraceae bacterium]|nr:hypothetical protein [Oscillospiraceae bacterium]
MPVWFERTTEDGRPYGCGGCPALDLLPLCGGVDCGDFPQDGVAVCRLFVAGG